MTKYTRHTGKEKIQILMELINTSVGINELCCKDNLAPATLHSWKEKFIEGGKLAIESKNKNEKRLNAKIEMLTRMVGELTIANEILKKHWRETKDDLCKTVTLPHESKSRSRVHRSLKGNMVLQTTSKKTIF